MTEVKKSSRSLAGIAVIVAIATLISKVAGLVRQQAIAAAFGVGAVADAYNYAYVIPGFLLILLGGINGPFHSAIVSVVAKRKREEIGPLVETITTLVGGILLLVSISLVIFADPLMNLVAPGLGETPAGLEIRKIAVQQFQIMAPMALLAALIGIGFGTLNAADSYWLPSISPIFSSLTVIIALAGLAWQLGIKMTQPQYALLGGVILAWATLAGAFLQWLVQIPVMWRANLGKLRLRFDFQQPGVSEVLKIMLPATFSSGMLQINVYTDLFFASYIPQAAAAMQYSGLLIQTPLGIVSNVILVPFLPIFARLADPDNWSELRQRIRQALVLTAITMLPLSALMITLSMPIVRIIYERYAFDLAASKFVSSLLIAYSIGMFVYLGRDVLVRVFYALGDAETPFKISIINIFLNALLDYIFVQFWGAPGLVLATVGVNLISFITMLWLLNIKLGGMMGKDWILPFVGLMGASVITGLASWGTLSLSQQFLGDRGILILLLQLGLASAIGLIVFYGLTMMLKLEEFDMFINRLKEKFIRKKSEG